MKENEIVSENGFDSIDLSKYQEALEEVESPEPEEDLFKKYNDYDKEAAEEEHARKMARARKAARARRKQREQEMAAAAAAAEPAVPATAAVTEKPAPAKEAAVYERTYGAGNGSRPPRRKVNWPVLLLYLLIGAAIAAGVLFFALRHVRNEQVQTPPETVTVD